MIQTEPQRDHHRQVERVNLTRSEMFEREIQPQLPSQNPEHELMTKSPILRIETSFRAGQQRRRVRVLVFNAPQNFEGGATCGRDVH